MKEVKAILQPFMLPHVRDALHALEGLSAITTSEFHGVGAREIASYEEHVRVKLEVLVPDRLVGAVVDVIQRHAHTGNPGDGYVLVIPVERTTRIRTGEDVVET